MKQMMMESPVGWLLIREERGAITGVSFLDAPLEEEMQESQLLQNARQQLEEYFRGERKAFTLPLRFSGTVFQERCWKAMQHIPYGKMSSYEEIAAGAGNIKACRAAGMACRRNPIVIIVPCHRVAGKNGCPTGFNGGIWRKEKLQALERKYSE